MDVSITFTCGCGGFIDEIIYTDEPEILISGNDEVFEAWNTIVCTECGKDYDAQILSNAYETKLDLPHVLDLHWEILTKTELDEIASELDETHQLEKYRKVSTDIITLLRHQYPEDVKTTLYSMLFAQVVTAVETYLSSSFVSTVMGSEELIRKLVETDPEIAKRQFSLKEIFTQWEGLKLLVAKYLKDLIFHDIKKIKPMYKSVLDLDFGEVPWLFKAILVRHDCVHRSGFDKEGNQHIISSDEIIELVKQCTRLVANIEGALTERK
ncbi:hypothetical protein [Pseudomonas canadensis]|uniref:RiboL-PSP-HEPN domain-containing protein n=1 Tax=Pseudomonas canadensis TaxID=915099 RepID=A0ABZ0ZZN4_9PSED|nr:hypothetical protein [Pseudomonas canadensis]WRI22582.1 hypothetical protein SPL95_18405 [Pseudomonas canadensis]